MAIQSTEDSTAWNELATGNTKKQLRAELTASSATGKITVVCIHEVLTITRETKPVTTIKTAKA